MPRLRPFYTVVIQGFDPDKPPCKQRLLTLEMAWMWSFQSC